MKNINPSLAIMIVSVIFAGIIIFAASINSPQIIVFSLIAVWFVPFGYFIQMKNKAGK